MDKLVELGALGCVALAIAMLLFTVSVDLLPSIALGCFVLLPVGYIAAVPVVLGRYLTPAVIVLAVWSLRSRLEIGPRAPRAKRLGAVGFFFVITGVCLLYKTVSSINHQRSVLWDLSIVAGFLLPVLNAGLVTDRARGLMWRTWMWLGVIIGVMAIGEGLSGHTLLGSLYSDADDTGAGVVQHWSVVRATTTLGHPLMNGTFLAVTATIAVADLMRSRNTKLAGVCAASAVGGLVCTVSRSADGALAAGLAVVLAFLSANRAVRDSRKIASWIAAAGVGYFVLTSPLLAERDASSEGIASAQYRSTVLQVAKSIASSDSWLGSGAGNSGKRAVLAGYQLPIENSYLALLVSVGIAGLAALAITVFVLAARCLRAGEVAAGAGMVSFAVAAYAWPVLDSNPSIFFMLGALALLAPSAFRPSAEVSLSNTAGRKRLATLPPARLAG
jgi:hypothetical protein